MMLQPVRQSGFVHRTLRSGFAILTFSTGLYVGPFLPNPVVWPKAAENVAKLATKSLILGHQDSNLNEGEDSLPLFVTGSSEDEKKTASAPKLVSVIVPVYNEGSQQLKNFLTKLCHETSLKYHTEIILVNASCTDNSFENLEELVEDLPAGIRKLKIVVSAPGRGKALIQGARVATGDLLFFLHADSAVPHGYDEVVRSSLAKPSTFMCTFKFGIDTLGLENNDPVRHSLSRLEYLTNLRSKWLWLPYGDQGFGISRFDFHRLGGFKPFAMMEDFDFSSRARQFALQHRKKIVTLNESILCSSRRWERNGVFGNTVRNWGFVVAFVWLNAEPENIFRWYYRN